MYAEIWWPSRLRIRKEALSVSIDIWLLLRSRLCAGVDPARQAESQLQAVQGFKWTLRSVKGTLSLTA